MTAYDVGFLLVILVAYAVVEVGGRVVARVSLRPLKIPRSKWIPFMHRGPRVH